MSSSNSCFRYSWKELCMPRCTLASRKEIGQVFGLPYGFYGRNFCFNDGCNVECGFCEVGPHCRKRRYYRRREC